jgi:hypothetical protein
MATVNNGGSNACSITEPTTRCYWRMHMGYEHASGVNLGHRLGSGKPEEHYGRPMRACTQDSMKIT